MRPDPRRHWGRRESGDSMARQTKPAAERLAAVTAAQVDPSPELREGRAAAAPFLPRCSFCDERRPIAFKLLATDAEGTLLDAASGCVECRPRVRAQLASRFNVELGELGQQSLGFEGRLSIGPVGR